MKHTFVRTRAAQKEHDELTARISDPQDLEDGLLAVAHDEATARIMDSMAKWEDNLIADIFASIPSNF